MTAHNSHISLKCPSGAFKQIYSKLANIYFTLYINLCGVKNTPTFYLEIFL